YVQSSKMVHAALLLLMLEAVTADLVFTISLKRSTQNLQLSTSSPADYPIFCPCAVTEFAKRIVATVSNTPSESTATSCAISDPCFASSCWHGVKRPDGRIPS
ncbi:MAG: hypothetical protein WBF07_19085, partial [Xanthobacteraceae bacterium]